MTFLFHIATANLDNVIPFIIIIGVIISKIIKATSGIKNIKPHQNPQADDQKSEYRAAPNELRNFLESLAGIPQEIKTPKVVAPPLPTKQPQQAVQQKTTKQIKHIPQQPTAKIQTITPVAKDEKYHKQTTSTKFKWIENNKDSQALVSPIDVAGELISRKSLAKAIILKEILSPPVALRKT